MAKMRNLPTRMVLSVRLYRMLLTVYPTEFRQYYGGPMVQVFGDCCRQALHNAGTTGLVSLWWRTVLDTIKTAIEEHTQRGTYMYKVKFIKLSGWAFIVAGLVIALGMVAGSRPEYDHYNAASLPIDKVANAAVTPLIVMGFLLVSVGSLGLFLRYGRRSGSFGRYSLALGAISGVIGSVSYLMLIASNWSGAWWLIVVASITLEFLGLVFFGIDSLRQCTLPRWNGLPIIAGVGLPIYMISGMIIEYINGRWPNTPFGVSFLMILFTLTGLAGLGYLLQADAHPAELTAAAA